MPSDRRRFKGRSNIDISSLFGGDSLENELVAVDPSEVDFNDSTFDARTQTRFKPKSTFTNILSGGRAQSLANELNQQQIINDNVASRNLLSQKELANYDKELSLKYLPKENDLKLLYNNNLFSDTAGGANSELGKAFTSAALNKANAGAAASALAEKKDKLKNVTALKDHAIANDAARSEQELKASKNRRELRTGNILGDGFVVNNSKADLRAKRLANRTSATKAKGSEIQNRILQDAVENPERYQSLPDGTFADKSTGLLYKWIEEPTGEIDKATGMQKTVRRLLIMDRDGTVPQRKKPTGGASGGWEPASSTNSPTRKPFTGNVLGYDENSVAGLF